MYNYTLCFQKSENIYNCDIDPYIFYEYKKNLENKMNTRSILYKTKYYINNGITYSNANSTIVNKRFVDLIKNKNNKLFIIEDIEQDKYTPEKFVYCLEMEEYIMESYIFTIGNKYIKFNIVNIDNKQNFSIVVNNKSLIDMF